ncbi:MAG: ATP-binding protein [Dissulfuribacterales bacterium]
MKIAIASGKGGTGKTTVAVSLALAARGKRAIVDCDVEEPNCHIFLKPVIEKRIVVTMPVPAVDMSRCNFCKKCQEICQFKAIAVFGRHVMTFSEMCHGCGGCMLICPQKAISEGKREIGVVQEGTANGLLFIEGRLRVGEAMSPPLIHAVQAQISDFEQSGGLVIVDAPPGTSCPVIASIRRANYTILVTEPTPFGLHDLKLAVGVLQKLGQPFGVVLNRADMGSDETERWCEANGISILMRIPFDRRIAQGYSRGEPLFYSRPDLRERFEALLKEVSS